MKELFNIPDTDLLNVNDATVASKVLKLTKSKEPVVTVTIPKSNNSADEDYVRIHFKNAIQKIQQEAQAPKSMHRLTDVLDQGVKGIEQALFCYFTDRKAVVVLGENTPFPFWAMSCDKPLIIPLVLAPKASPVFWILTLNTDSCSLYAVSNQSVEELECPDLPLHISAAVGDDSLQRQLQLHSGSGNNQSNPIFHGQGGKSDSSVEKRKVEKYFSIIGNAVRRFHSQSKSNPPLVVAGVKSTLAIFENCFQSGESFDSMVATGELNGAGESVLKELAREIQENSRSKAYLENQIRYELTRRRDLISETPQSIASSLTYSNARSIFFDARSNLWKTECRKAMQDQNEESLKDILALNSHLVAAVKKTVDIRPVNSAFLEGEVSIFSAVEQFYSTDSMHQGSQNST